MGLFQKFYVQKYKLVDADLILIEIKYFFKLNLKYYTSIT